MIQRSVLSLQKIAITAFILLFVINLSQCAFNLEPAYTQDLAKFKKDKFSIRLELIVGCWVISGKYNEKQLGGIPISQKETVSLVKICLKKIKRKQAIAAITSLAGKDMGPLRTLQEFVQPTDNQTLQFLKTLKTTSKRTKSLPQQQLDILSFTKFDQFLLSNIQQYETEMIKMKSLGGVNNVIDLEIKKRTKYYLGFIPASFFTHTTLVITISLCMICCCTCYKYTQKMDEDRQNGLKKKLLRGAAISSAKPGRMMRKE